MKPIRTFKWIFLYLIVPTIVLLFLYSHSISDSSRLRVFKNNQQFSYWPPYENKASLSVEKCKNLISVQSLSELQSNVVKWSNSRDETCLKWYRKFCSIYSTSFRIGHIKILPAILTRMSNSFNNSPDLLNELHNQHVIHIFNTFTKEHSSFSPLFSKRPQSHPTDSQNYIEEIVKTSQKSCDFCHVETYTSKDPFGRIKTNYCVSAANTFKLDKWHSLIISKQHHPLNLSQLEVVDLFYAANLWFKKVNSLESEFKYPWLLWDIMPHAGASQVHPHAQVGLTRDYYAGMYQNTRIGAEDYFKKFGSNYFSDLTAIHSILGLSVSLGNATAIAQLTSKKDTEITIISDELGVDFSKLTFYTLKTFYNMGFYDASSLSVFPIFAPYEERLGSMPALMRIASRGDVSTVRSEIRSFELFEFSNINVDPYEVIKKLRETIQID